MCDNSPATLKGYLYSGSYHTTSMGRSTTPYDSRSNGGRPEPDPDPATNPYLAERPKHRDPEWLREQYWGEGKSMAAIARDAGVTDRVISNSMDRYGVEKRPTGRDRLKDMGVYSYLQDPVWLYGQYWVKGKSIPDIAGDLGVNRMTVHEAMVDADVPRRSNSEAQKLRFAKERGEWDGPGDG